MNATTEIILSIEPKKLNKALSIIRPAISKDYAAAILCQVGLFTREDGTWLGATNGHIMAIVKVDGYNGHNSVSAIDPKLLSKQTEPIKFYFTKDHGKLLAVNNTTVDPYKFGSYPDLLNHIPYNRFQLASFQIIEFYCRDFYEAINNSEKLSVLNKANEPIPNYYYIELAPNSSGNMTANGIEFFGTFSNINLPKPQSYNRDYLVALAKACKKVGKVNLLMYEQNPLYAYNDDFHFIVMPLSDKPKGTKRNRK